MYLFTFAGCIIVSETKVMFKRQWKTVYVSKTRFSREILRSLWHHQFGKDQGTFVLGECRGISGNLVSKITLIILTYYSVELSMYAPCSFWFYV